MNFKDVVKYRAARLKESMRESIRENMRDEGNLMILPKEQQSILIVKVKWEIRVCLSKTLAAPTQEKKLDAWAASLSSKQIQSVLLSYCKSL